VSKDLFQLSVVKEDVRPSWKYSWTLW